MEPDCWMKERNKEKKEKEEGGREDMASTHQSLGEKPSGLTRPLLTLLI